jgi:hypothetical protein
LQSLVGGFSRRDAPDEVAPSVAPGCLEAIGVERQGRVEASLAVTLHSLNARQGRALAYRRERDVDENGVVAGRKYPAADYAGGRVGG